MSTKKNPVRETMAMLKIEDVNALPELVKSVLSASREGPLVLTLGVNRLSGAVTFTHSVERQRAGGDINLLLQAIQAVENALRGTLLDLERQKAREEVVADYARDTG